MEFSLSTIHFGRAIPNLVAEKMRISTLTTVQFYVTVPEMQIIYVKYIKDIFKA